MTTSKFEKTPPGPVRNGATALENHGAQPCSIARPCRLTLPAPCAIPAPCGQRCDLNLGPERHAVLDLGNLARLAIIALPASRESFRQQAEELFAQVQCIVSHQPVPLTATTMMVFLRNGADEAECARIVRGRFGDEAPVTTYVVQPPCEGAALAIELWALGGPGVEVMRHNPNLLSVQSDGIRWVHCGGIRPPGGTTDAYTESEFAFREMQRQLALAGATFDQVARTWIYVNHITSGPDGHQRYQELNRARTDFFRDLRFDVNAREQEMVPSIYPASTGIGTVGDRMAMCCMALDSTRPDVFLVPLENPLQTPAYDYHARYSPQSPKFSRAMAVVQGHFVTTLVSGTASIVNAKTCFPGDIVRQTEQTLTNIEQLIAAENFARHGLSGGGATMKDIAKLRVYVKNLEDYEKCREVCERLLPGVPAIYLHADVCRPDLLVEIEAVAFSPYDAAKAARVNGHARNGTLHPR